MAWKLTDEQKLAIKAAVIAIVGAFAEAYTGIAQAAIDFLLNFF